MTSEKGTLRFRTEKRKQRESTNETLGFFMKRKREGPTHVTNVLLGKERQWILGYPYPDPLKSTLFSCMVVMVMETSDMKTF